MTKHSQALKRFRRCNARIDYYPDDDALEALERLRAMFAGATLRSLIDMAVIEGERQISGNLQRTET